jgi:hypothetical protein
MRLIPRILALLGLSLLFSQFSVYAVPITNAISLESYNVLIRTDNKSLAEIQSELIRSGVPSEVVEQLEITTTLTSPSISGGVTARSQARIASHLSCIAGFRAIANFQTGTGTMVSVFQTTTTPLGRSGNCPDPSCTWTHIAGGGTTTAIFLHEAIGFRPISYLFGGASCIL